MVARLTTLLLIVCTTLMGAVQHLGHLCEVEGPMMGPDCCCGDKEDKAADQQAEVGQPGCCDQLTEVVSLSGAISVDVKSPDPSSLAAPYTRSFPRTFVAIRATHGLSRLRAPPDPPRLRLHVRNSVFLV